MGVSDLKIFESSEVGVLAAWKNVFINVWPATPDAATLRRTLAFSNQVSKQYPEGYLALAVLETIGRVNLTAEARAEAEKLSKNPSPNLMGVAQVIEGKGLAATATRALATTMMFLGGSGGPPNRIFGSVELGAGWLVPLLKNPPAGLSASGLVAAVAQVRKR